MISSWVGLIEPVEVLNDCEKERIRHRFITYALELVLPDSVDI